MVQASHSDIPLFIGVCDADEAARSVVGHALSLEKSVVAVEIAGTIEESQVITQRTEINTIFIDPLSLGLNEASELIFSIRRNSPEIVFVLYTDMSAAEENRKEFFRGERGRFSHYYTLDKNTPVAAFQDELRSILHTCQSDLGWRMSKVTLERLLSKAKQLSDPSQKTSEELALLRDINRTLTVLWKEPVRAISQSRKKTVFVSHRFADKEYVEGLIRLLEQTGFEVVTGRLANTYISKAIVERIRACEFSFAL